jgi:hypothetical protein
MESLGRKDRFPNKMPMSLRQGSGSEPRGQNSPIPENDGGLALIAHESHHAT